MMTTPYPRAWADAVRSQPMFDRLVARALRDTDIESVAELEEQVLASMWIEYQSTAAAPCSNCED